jgi:hypothetical protein
LWGKKLLCIWWMLNNPTLKWSLTNYEEPM